MPPRHESTDPAPRHLRSAAGDPRPARGRLAASMAVFMLAACAPTPPGNTPVPTTRPTPTADVRVTAADAFLTALTAYHVAIDPVERNICAMAATTPSLRDCWSRKLAVQKAFDATVSTITFPDDLRTDVQTFRYVVGRLESAMAGIASAPLPARDINDLGVYSSASVDFLQITSNLRQELGILPTPSP